MGFSSSLSKFQNKFNGLNVQLAYVSIYRPWNWHPWFRKYYYLRYDVVGKCGVEAYKRNMAWHVVGNKAHPATTPCTIKTKDPITIPSLFHECQVSVEVRDVDYNFQHKEESDFLCMKVVRTNGDLITGSKTCQKDDVKTRRLTEEYRLGTIVADYTVGYFRSHAKTILTSKWISKDGLNKKGGFHIVLTAMTDHRYEHWYADDLMVTCRGTRFTKSYKGAVGNQDSTTTKVERHNSLDYDVNDMHHTKGGQKRASTRKQIADSSPGLAKHDA